jgi:hypothetical protein
MINYILPFILAGIFFIFLGYFKRSRDILIVFIEIFTLFDNWGLNKDQKHRSIRFLFYLLGFTCIITGILLLFM